MEGIILWSATFRFSVNRYVNVPIILCANHVSHLRNLRWSNTNLVNPAIVFSCLVTAMIKFIVPLFLQKLILLLYIVTNPLLKLAKPSLSYDSTLRRNRAENSLVDVGKSTEK
ncbi:hypothetical protein VNO77_23907 [Canavalia gladiata]|uniref:Uncharacterized protein n=1 Tax=Canavalia gladiata TaxID=3824 RepID=A0AAN9L635_CANGL